MRHRRTAGRRDRTGPGKDADKAPEKPARVGDLLPGLFKRLGITGEVAAQESLVRWAAVVGERIAGVTRPRGISSGVLFVEVASSAWLSELNLMRHEILRKLNAGRPEGRVERLVFTLSEGVSGMERSRPDR
jgi:predicted nucleic acid-binding Zn ribbon protein